MKMLSVGDEVDRSRFTVERGKVAEFARATFAEDPAHTDVEYVRSLGFDDVLATATHVVVVGHQRDARETVSRLGLEHSRVVVGSVSWQYERPLMAGDDLRGIRRVVDDQRKISGSGTSMRFVTLETVFTDERSVRVATQREVLIEREQS